MAKSLLQGWQQTAPWPKDHIGRPPQAILSLGHGPNAQHLGLKLILKLCKRKTAPMSGRANSNLEYASAQQQAPSAPLLRDVKLGDCFEGPHGSSGAVASLPIIPGVSFQCLSDQPSHNYILVHCASSPHRMFPRDKDTLQRDPTQAKPALYFSIPLGGC